MHGTGAHTCICSPTWPVKLRGSTPNAIGAVNKIGVLLESFEQQVLRAPSYGGMFWDLLTPAFLQEQPNFVFNKCYEYLTATQNSCLDRANHVLANVREPP